MAVHQPREGLLGAVARVFPQQLRVFDHTVFAI
jgi:hypothetical protein